VTEFPTRRRPPQLVADVAAAIQRLLQGHTEVGACAGVGVSVSGLVDPAGRLRLSPTLGWREVDLLEPLRAATMLPVVVENSTKACVLGQVWAVRGDAAVDGPVAFVNVSDGVGVGLAVDGKLLRGTSAARSRRYGTSSRRASARASSTTPSSARRARRRSSPSRSASTRGCAGRRP
jgi:predicted NBD/HSP70 family sugar kinase